MPRWSGMLWSLTLATSSSLVGGVWWKPRPLNGGETCPEENRGNAPNILGDEPGHGALARVGSALGS